MSGAGFVSWLYERGISPAEYVSYGSERVPPHHIRSAGQGGWSVSIGRRIPWQHRALRWPTAASVMLYTLPRHARSFYANALAELAESWIGRTVLQVATAVCCIPQLSLVAGTVLSPGHAASAVRPVLPAPCYRQDAGQRFPALLQLHLGVAGRSLRPRPDTTRYARSGQNLPM